jgi:hypothetical protein
MKILKICLFLLCFFTIHKSHGVFIKSKLSTFNLEKKDTLINSAKKNYIGKKINGIERKKIISLYLLAINRQYEKPEMSDVYSKDYQSLFSVFKYKSILIQNKFINTYYVNINFEDGMYEAILAFSNAKKTPYNLLLLYENLESATNYKCTSTITDELIFINRKSEDFKSNNYYISKDGYFLDYFKESEKNINMEWGDKEGFLSKNKDSIHKYQYRIKGVVKNHLKEGLWEERKYSFEKKKSVDLKKNYLNGIAFEK